MTYGSKPHKLLLPALAIALFSPLVSSPSYAQPQESNADMLVYIGTYTRGNSEGIYLLSLDTKTGAMKQVGVTKGVDNPSFLAFHPNKKYLYAVNEVTKYDGKPAGAITAFTIDAKTGSLKKLNQQSTGGGAPCHLVIDKAGKSVLIANYVGGNIAHLPIADDGKLKPIATLIQHKGSSVNPKRQKGPHAHSINLDAKNGYAVAADLGLDKLLIYKFDPKTSKLSETPAGTTSLAPGAGPRHFAFHPDGRHAYVINELDSTITALEYDAKNGRLTKLQTLPTLPKDFKEGNSTAEVQVHPSGKFVYGSNRGHNSIAIFRVDERTGKLTVVGHESTKGKTPRNFGIDPTGQYLLAANQQSNTIVAFRIDQKTGELKPTGHTLSIPTPVCVKFLKR